MRLKKDQGGPGAWAATLAHRDRLLRIARSRTATQMDAEDVVQETLLRAAANAEEIDEDRLSAWLTAVTVRLCVDSHRRRQREARTWARASGTLVAHGVEDEVADRDWATWVARHVDLLPPRQRAALLLKAAGHDTRSVAHELGVSYRGAESLLARARRRLRGVLLPGVVAVAVLWQALGRLTGSSVKTTLVASFSGILALSALVGVQSLAPERAPVVTPTHAPSAPIPSREAAGTGPPRGPSPSGTPLPSPSRPLTGTGPDLPLPSVSGLPPLPQPQLPPVGTPLAPVTPRLPLPTLDGS